MKCEQICKCSFIQDVSKAMPITAVMIKALYCKKVDYGCAKYRDHEVIALDVEKGNLSPGPIMNGIELFEKQYCESYKKICIRRQRETT